MNCNAAGAETRPPVVAWFHREGRCPTDRDLAGAETRPPSVAMRGDG